MAAAIALAACGDDNKTAGSSSTGAAEESAYPVTMRSKHGSATIAQRPKRVVTLDNQATDDALALGVLPSASPRSRTSPAASRHGRSRR
jgi:iron complex transport system substrate-binding protein